MNTKDIMKRLKELYLNGKVHSVIEEDDRITVKNSQGVTYSYTKDCKGLGLLNDAIALQERTQ